MSGAQQVRTIYRFDQFCLDTGRGTLRSPHGDDITLRPKAFLLLRCLLDNPDRLLSRDDLFEALWPGVTVSDDSLTQCVSDLRRAFGSRANNVLRTIPRRGYMLIVDVDRQIVEPSFAPRSAGPPVISASNAETSRRELLLMERIPASQGDAEILDEIWNELFLQLARFEELRVVRAVSSLGTQGYRVRSEARLTSGRIRALILLEDAETGAVIWTEQVDHQAAGRETMAESVIIPLAHHIAYHATSETMQRARHKSRLALSARELYLLATDHHHRGTEADTATAHSLLERAIAIDPNYAPAYAWLGYAVQRGLIYGWGADKGEAAREKALALTRHSTLLAPDSPICLARLALCLNLSRQFGEAVATARLALSGTWIPSIDDCVTCSEILAQNGHAEEAIEVMQRILRFDSYALPTTRSVLGRALLMAGRPQEALPELRICAARLPDYLACHHSILMAAHETGQTDEACRAFENIQRLQPGWKPTESGGPWMFRNAADFERLQVAFDAAQAALQPQQHPTTGEVLSFRLRDGTGRS